jgi:Ca2+-binding RTX toxin-like protein
LQDARFAHWPAIAANSDVFPNPNGNRREANKDTMTGGAGNDVYIVENGGDKLVEAANGGIDTIYTTLTSFDLNSAANVENLSSLAPAISVSSARPAMVPAP